MSDPLPERVAARVAQVYGSAEADLLAFLARRAAEGHATGYDEWAVRKAREAAALRAAAAARASDLEAVIARLMAEAIDDAYAVGLTSAGAGPLAIAGRPDAVLRLIEREVGAMPRQVTLRILRSVEDAYRTVQAEVSAAMLTGRDTLPQAIQRSLNRYAERGITGFVDRGGRGWGMQEYAEMQTRTATAHAYTEGRLDSFREQGRTLVIISDSPEECPVCRPWEGRVVGLDRPGILNTGEEVPSLGEAVEAGLFHPNCTHSVNVYQEGLTRPLTSIENPAGYELRQEQRYHERQVRRWRNRDAVAFTPEAQRHAQAHLTAARQRYHSFIDQHDRIPVTWRTRVLRPTG